MCFLRSSRFFLSVCSLSVPSFSHFVSRLDLFEYGLQKFSDEEFDAVGINAEQRSLSKCLSSIALSLPILTLVHTPIF